MNPAVATSVLERRGHIRNRARAGEDPKAIAADLRVGTRTVLGILAMPETDLERDAADLLAGWSPDCMDAGDWRDWQRMNPANVGGGKALKPCWDCPLEFAVEMRAEHRCNGSPGRPIGRPVGRPIDIEPRPIDIARARLDRPTTELLERARQHSLVDRLTAPTRPLEEPAMPDAAPNPLSTLSEAAETAAEAHRAKLLADEAWEEARAILVAAWGDVRPLMAQDDLDAALGELVDVAEQAIEAGVAAEADEDPTSGPDDTTSPVSAGPDVAAAPTPHQVRQATTQPPTDLTARQRMVLSGLRAGQGRADIARDLKVTYQTVDGIIEQIARKGLIPAELFPLLPGRFAKYATVASR